MTDEQARTLRETTAEQHARRYYKSDHFINQATAERAYFRVLAESLKRGRIIERLARLLGRARQRAKASRLTAPAEGCTCSEFGSGTQPCPVHGGTVETRTAAPADNQARTLRERIAERIVRQIVVPLYRSDKPIAAMTPFEQGQFRIWVPAIMEAINEVLTAPVEGAPIDPFAAVEAAAKELHPSNSYYDSERRSGALLAVDRARRQIAPAEGVAPLPQENEQKNANDD